jgi:hypothetical protein
MPARPILPQDHLLFGSSFMKDGPFLLPLSLGLTCCGPHLTQIKGKSRAMY